MELASPDKFEYFVVYSEVKSENGYIKRNLCFEVRFCKEVLFRYTPYQPECFYSKDPSRSGIDTQLYYFKHIDRKWYVQVKHRSMGVKVTLAVFPVNETFDAAIRAAREILSADPEESLQVATRLGCLE
jgi:hypothetical protein